jgi:hypothetical protein
MPGKVRGRPFQPGNPGRPSGSKNKTTQALEHLADGQAEQVWRKVVDQALAGDVPSQRMFLERVYPPPKARPINVPIPPIKGPQDLVTCNNRGSGRGSGEGARIRVALRVFEGAVQRRNSRNQ